MKKLFLFVLCFLIPFYFISCGSSGIDMGTTKIKSTDKVKVGLKDAAVETEISIAAGGIKSGTNDPEKEITITVADIKATFEKDLEAENSPVALPADKNLYEVVSAVNIQLGNPTDIVDIEKDIDVTIPASDIESLALPASAIPKNDSKSIGGAKFMTLAAADPLTKFADSGWMGICMIYSADQGMIGAFRANNIRFEGGDFVFTFSVKGKGKGLNLKIMILFGDPEKVTIGGESYKKAVSKITKIEPLKQKTGLSGKNE